MKNTKSNLSILTIIVLMSFTLLAMFPSLVDELSNEKTTSILSSQIKKNEVMLNYNIISPSPFAIMNIKTFNKIINEMLKPEMTLSNNITLERNMTSVRNTKLGIDTYGYI